MTTARAAAGPSSAAAGGPALRAAGFLFLAQLAGLESYFAGAPRALSSVSVSLGAAVCSSVDCWAEFATRLMSRPRPRLKLWNIFGLDRPSRDLDETSARGELHVVDCTGLPRLRSG